MEGLDTNFMKILGILIWLIEKLIVNKRVILRIIGRIVGELWSNFR